MYGLLVGIGYVFLYPVLYMIATGLMDINDLLSSSVHWIPSTFYTSNFQRAFRVLNFWPVLLQTLTVTVVPSVIQTLVAAFVGYGFARFKFMGKNLFLILMLGTFIIPPQVLVIPRYLLFNQLGMLDSLASYILPAATGQGLNNAIFILIFYQTFRAIPKSLEEAAQLDGAGHFRIFFTIAIPMATAAFIVSFLFSFVWYWNETYLAAIYFGNSLTTLPLQLQRFVDSFNRMFGGQNAGMTTNLNEGIEMAGTFITIVPLLLVYFIMQRWFVEGVDRSGITGE
jgi:multiple sugar transport system permease protein